MNRFATVAALLAALGSCSTSRVPAAAGTAGEDGPLEDYSPSEPSAARYEPSSPWKTPGPFARQVLRRLKNPPPVDESLSRVAEELARLGHRRPRAAASATEFLLAYFGVAVPTPGRIVARVEGGTDEQLASELAKELAQEVSRRSVAWVGVGIHSDGATRIAVALLQDRHLDFAPVAKKHEPNTTFEFSSELPEGFSDPELVVTGADGRDRVVALQRSRRRVRGEVSCGTGAHRVELLGTNRSGPLVLANFPVYCGVESRRRFRLEGADESSLSVEAAEQRIFELINGSRAQAGLAALDWDSTLAEVARAHSKDMRQGDFVAHVSPTTGSAGDRVDAAGVRAALVLENVARAAGPADAHRGLMDSPGHRMNIMSEEATHVGVGVAFVDDSRAEILVTELFTRESAPRDLRAAEVAVREKAARLGRKNRWHANPRLEREAQRLAETVASTGEAPEQLKNIAGKGIDSVSASISVILRPEDFQFPEARGTATSYGVGVARGKHPDTGEDALVVVSLVGARNR